MRDHPENSVRRSCDESPCRKDHIYYCMAPACGDLFKTNENTIAVEESGRLVPNVQWPYHSWECAVGNRLLFWKERQLGTRWRDEVEDDA